MTHALTRRQREVLDFVTHFVADKGYSPSLEEIAAAFDLSSVATVHKHVKHLVDKGYLRKAWNRSRSVEPVPDAGRAGRAGGQDSVELPILGAVAAGQPIEAIEPDAGTAETLAVPAAMTARGRDHYVLRVRGDSMIDDQICDGDFVVIESRREARNGETVVALVDGQEATLKRFYRARVPDQARARQPDDGADGVPRLPGRDPRHRARPDPRVLSRSCATRTQVGMVFAPLLTRRW